MRNRNIKNRNLEFNLVSQVFKYLDHKDILSFIQYLRINGEDLPLPTSYSFDLKDVQADSSGETEAGTTQRDIVRSGVVNIQVSFQVSATWLQKLSAFRKMPVH